MVRWLKRTGVEMLVGAVVGFLVWCVAGKSITSMMFGSIGGTFSCQADVENALTRFLSMQLYAAIAGALVFAVAIGLIRRALDRRKLRAAGPTPVQSSVS
jgi:Mg/Co/Ni transporter MgtE